MLGGRAPTCHRPNRLLGACDRAPCIIPGSLMPVNMDRDPVKADGYRRGPHAVQGQVR
jgi:hypothetical protein